MLEVCFYHSSREPTIAQLLKSSRYSRLLVPPQLYSHSDQTVQWQSSIADQPFQTGWGGRMADELMKTLNQNQKISMSVSLVDGL